MTKTRQQDFGRVRLKPGRPLKKSTLSSVKFQSRKIVMPKDRGVKKKSEYTIAECKRKILNAGNEREKNIHLNDLNKLIHRQTGSLKTELYNIFEAVLDNIRDPYDDVRSTALKIILYVLDNTEDSELRCHAKLLNANISTIMKNPIAKIASSSLLLLDRMVKNHPKLICYNMDILQDLLPNEKVHFTRKVVGERGTFLYSESEEINYLGHINTFFKSMLENESDLVKNEDDKDVYMDENQPMFLELYTGGGLKPIDIEEVCSKEFNHAVDHFEQVRKLSAVIGSLIEIIPGIFSRIIRGRSNEDDYKLRSESVADLSIVAQVLCHMVEISEKNSQTVAIEEIATIITEKLYSPYRKRFPFEYLFAAPGTSLEPLAILNASLCYLFMKFLFSNECSDYDWQIIERYLNSLFAPNKSYSSEIKCRCIPLFIKMIQLFSYKKGAPEAITILLKQLVVLLKTRINHPNKKKLIDFLYNMSVSKEYEFWFESEPMMLWFNWLLSHLKENIYKLDKKLIKIISKISKLHPSFTKKLDFHTIKPLLKHRNDDLKELAITLLSNMEIDEDTFQNVYDIICLDSYPRKFAVALVQALDVRFHECSMSEKTHVDYMEFLLNTAISVYNFSSNRFIDLDNNEYTEAVKIIQNGIPFTIVPSLYWKEHSQLFKICQAYLRNFPGVAVNLLFIKLLKELLYDKIALPIHCALALLKLDVELPDETKSEDHQVLLRDLNFSCLMTTSVLMKIPMDTEWRQWNVVELMNSISFTPRSGIQILELLYQGDYCKEDKLDGIVAYHILRVLKVLLEKESLNIIDCPDTADHLVNILGSLAEECSDENFKHQPLYSDLFYIFDRY